MPFRQIATVEHPSLAGTIFDGRAERRAVVNEPRRDSASPAPAARTRVNDRLSLSTKRCASRGSPHRSRDDGSSTCIASTSRRVLAKCLLLAALMMRILLRVVVIFVTIACILSVASSSLAWTLKTPSIAQHPEGYLGCNVLATSKRRIGIVATVESATRTNVTEFGYGSRERTPDGFRAEETAGSFDSASDRYQCKVTVTGARHKDVYASLTSFDRDGVPIATVTSR
jgi:hypothetical protein